MSDGNIVAPYLDGGRRGVCINGGFLCLNGDDYSLEYASGYFNPDETETAMCDYCEDSCDPDEMIFTYDEQSVCNNCREEHFRYAYVSTSRARGWVHADNVVYCESNSEYYLDDPDVLSYHDIAECTVSGDYFKTDDMCSVEDGWAHADYAVPLSYNDYDYCLASDVKPVWFVYVIDNKITSFIHPDDVDKDDECHMSIEAALAAGLESDNDSINAVLSNFISTFAKAA
jgi:hypothetical protein